MKSGFINEVLADMQAGVFDFTKDGQCSNCGECCSDFLPISPEEIKKISAYIKKHGIKCDSVQAERIAWRNVKDWVAAQLALVETEQASMPQVFLPYLVSGEETLYEKMISSGFQPALQGTT